MKTVPYLKTICGLPVEATDAQLIERVQKLARDAQRHADAEEEKSVINQMITDSCGALTPQTAARVLKNRSAFQLSHTQPNRRRP